MLTKLHYGLNVRLSAQQGDHCLWPNTAVKELFWHFAMLVAGN